jgi:hypothetical protein
MNLTDRFVVQASSATRTARVAVPREEAAARARFRGRTRILMSP